MLDIGHCSALKVFGTELNLEALPAPHGDPRAGRRTSSPTRRARCCARGSKQGTAARSSSPSAVASTRSQRDLISLFTLGFPRATADGLLLHLRPAGAPRARGEDPRRRHHARTREGGARRRATARPRPVARRSPRPASSASRCPESVGGGGLGFLETCIVLEEVGRAAAPVPALAVMGLAAPALVAVRRHRRARRRRRRHAHRHRRAHRGGRRRVRTPSTTADRRQAHRREGLRARGLDAQRIVVSATDGLYLVDPSPTGVTVEREDTMLGVPRRGSCCDDAPATKLAGPEGLTWLLRARAGRAGVMMAGACGDRARAHRRRT